MRETKESVNKQIHKEWANANMETELECREFARNWMNQVRLRDLVGELQRLEAVSRRRIALFQAWQKEPDRSAERVTALFAQLEKNEGAIADELAFMREKLGWVVAS